MNGSAHLSRDYCLSCSESHEMDSVAPMLKHIPDTVSSHLDTKVEIRVFKLNNQN